MVGLERKAHDSTCPLLSCHRCPLGPRNQNALCFVRNFYPCQACVKKYHYTLTICTNTYHFSLTDVDWKRKVGERRELFCAVGVPTLLVDRRMRLYHLAPPSDPKKRPLSVSKPLHWASLTIWVQPGIGVVIYLPQQHHTPLPLSSPTHLFHEHVIRVLICLRCCLRVLRVVVIGTMSGLLKRVCTHQSVVYYLVIPETWHAVTVLSYAWQSRRSGSHLIYCLTPIQMCVAVEDYLYVKGWEWLHIQTT